MFLKTPYNSYINLNQVGSFSIDEDDNDHCDVIADTPAGREIVKRFADVESARLWLDSIMNHHGYIDCEACYG